MEALHNKLALDLLKAYEVRSLSLAHQGLEVFLRAGENVILQGSAPKNVFIILEGAVKIFHSTLKSSDYLIAIEGPGEILGEVEILTGELYSCSVEAIENVRMAALTKEDYLQWLESDHDFTLLINKIICDRLQKITKRAATHLSYPLEYSVLKLLKLLSNDSNSRVLFVSKGEIADYLGTSFRSVSRVLSILYEREILKSGNGTIEIVSIDTLNNVLSAYEE
ncbi:cAMP-binding domain of CRP or a regulatory subunit of cAMP-dependent protein kinases [Maridesulfovibrio ferrireducens]|uniref:cAMP-binding domain of CRP or a regulatory subunit of cAMP-dependent protein kinases n=1 Tax=Maridesulfovibrio ferrireducens TaxID=246191 RepID=A0A1G9G140_9BACT|nr:Crp/Fnr family transcriptional regulator [Maridesulfovibrio ferrireducens]SDK94349.1 cAMP-binding domain of CRP or a regulatory subunit of cAMP-dependent protein kinases [Maridesulfovibrio ferrireducens]